MLTLKNYFLGAPILINNNLLYLNFLRSFDKKKPLTKTLWQPSYLITKNASALEVEIQKIRKGLLLRFQSPNHKILK